MAIDIEKAREHFMRSQYILNDIDEDRKMLKGSVSEKEQRERMKKIYLAWEELEQQYMEYNLQILQSSDRISTANSVPSRRPSIGREKKTAFPQQRQGGPKSRIGKVYFMFSPPPEFKHSPRTDRTVRKGTFHIQQLLYMYKVFTRSSTKTTYLHVYGITSERNVYLRIKREFFDEVVDLELAALIFESSEDTHALLQSDADADAVDLGYAVENAPIMTGLSEMDDVSDCHVTVFEEPSGYQSSPQAMDHAIISGSWNLDGNELLYRVFSVPFKTMVVVHDLSTGRKLFFTVYRSLFDEDEDMMIASHLFKSTGNREPVELQVHKDDDVQRMLKEYESRPNISSSVSVKLPLPLVTPIKRPATAGAMGRTQTMLPEAAAPKRIVVEDFQSFQRRPVTAGNSSGTGSTTPSSGFVWSPKSKFSPLGSEQSHVTGKPDGSGSKPEKPFVTKETLSLVRNLLSGSNQNVHLYDPNLRFLAEQKSKVASNFNQYKTI